MKKLLAMATLIVMVVSIGVMVNAQEFVRPSVSVAGPSKRIVEEGESVTYTIEIAHGKETLKFNPETIRESFAFSKRTIVEIKPGNIYDIIYEGVSMKGEKSYITLEKGAGETESGILTLKTPASKSFMIYKFNQTTRGEVADYLLSISKQDYNDVKTSVFIDSDSKYNALYDENIMFGDENGNLSLERLITREEVYIINRRLEIND